MSEVYGDPPDGLLIWGPQGCGKSREAAEYAVSRAKSLRGVHRFVVPGHLPLQVPQDAPGFPMDAAVLVLDDLHEHWRRRRSDEGEQRAVGLSPGERVCELIEYFRREAGTVVVVATVREEWWQEMRADPAMRPLLTRLEAHVELKLVEDKDKERKYLEQAARARKLRVSDEVLHALVEANDGSFVAAGEHFDELVYDNPGPREMTLAEAEALKDACRRTWRQRVLPNLPPLQQEAVELASILSACRMPLRRVYVHALHRERTCTGRLARWLYPLRQRRALDRALDGLASGPFPEKAGQFQPHGSRLDDADRPRLLEEAAQVGRALFALGAERDYPDDLRTALAGLDEALWSLDPQPLPTLLARIIHAW